MKTKTKTIIKNLGVIFFVLFFGAVFNNALAVDEQNGKQPVNNTIAHIEEALKSLNANDLDIAEDHMRAARQSAKDISGGSIEVKAQRGSNTIGTARRQAQSGDTAAATATLKEALELFKSIHNASQAGGRGGLN
jgi:hypothetical protein